MLLRCALFLLPSAATFGTQENPIFGLNLEILVVYEQIEHLSKTCQVDGQSL